MKRRQRRKNLLSIESLEMKNRDAARAQSRGRGKELGMGENTVLSTKEKAALNSNRSVTEELHDIKERQNERRRRRKHREERKKRLGLTTTTIATIAKQAVHRRKKGRANFISQNIEIQKQSKKRGCGPDTDCCVR